MKSYKAFVTFGTLAFTLGWGAVARANDDIALSFALEPVGQDDPEAGSPSAAELDEGAIAASAPVIVANSADAPLPIPVGAEHPPISGDTSFPAGVYGGMNALALGTAQSVQTLLPPPPPAPMTAVQVAIVPPPEPPAPTRSIKDDVSPNSASPKPVAVSFVPEKPAWQKLAEQEPPQLPASPVPSPQKMATLAWDSIQKFFEGGTDSLVARAVGSAEGTRTPEGHKNPAYFGHSDPGNGVWNLGTFSYQHGARTPEEADAKQLERLKRQTEFLHQKALSKELELSPEELLNGIDLANQAPEAALDRGGYIDWLKEARALGMTGSEAIVWARTRSFIDPDTQRWNAPGLGNNIYSISHDQERRANAIARAINATPGSLADLYLAGADIASQSLEAKSEIMAQATLQSETDPVTAMPDEIPLSFFSPAPPINSTPAPVEVASALPPETAAERSDSQPDVKASAPSTTEPANSRQGLTGWVNALWSGRSVTTPQAPATEDADTSPFFNHSTEAIAIARNDHATSHPPTSVDEEAIAEAAIELTASEAGNPDPATVSTAQAIAPKAVPSQIANAETGAQSSTAAPRPSPHAAKPAQLSAIAGAVPTTRVMAANEDDTPDTSMTPLSFDEAEAPKASLEVALPDPLAPAFEASSETTQTPATAAVTGVSNSPADEFPTTPSVPEIVGIQEPDAIRNPVQRTTRLIPAVKQSVSALKETAERTTDEVIESFERLQKTLKQSY